MRVYSLDEVFLLQDLNVIKCFVNIVLQFLLNPVLCRIKEYLRNFLS